MPNRAPLRVLIVDDSREDRVEVKSALLRGSKRRFEFLEAELGAQAVAICRNSPPPACVLLDHHLPDMDAFELIEHLRPAAARLPSIPVVIVTGSNDDEMGGSASRAGAMGLIGKDWLTPDSLNRALESAIERHALFEKQEHLVAELRERDFRLQIALEGGRAGTFHHDLATNRVAWSTELERILGYQPGTFGGTFPDFLQHIHPEDAESTRAIIESAIAGCQEYEFEFRVTRVDGAIIWLAGRGRVSARSGGAADTITGVVFDVTERKRAEEELRSREQQLSLAQRAGQLGLWDWDIENDRASWSDRAWQLFEPGAEGGRVTYERWLSRIHPDDRASAAEANKRALAGVSYRDEFRVVHPDGTVHWLEAVADTLRRGSGAPYRMIGFVRDITERKVAEAALLASELRFRQMSEALPQIVFTYEPDGRCSWVNRFWRVYTGTDEFSHERWLESHHPEDLERLSMLWDEAFNLGEPFSAEYRVRRRDGSYGWHLSRVVPVRSESGTLVQWVGCSHDISAMRTEAQLREQLMAAERAARTQAEVANHLKDEFMATLSHELRTPLSNVISWARLMQKQFAGTDEKLQRGLSIILDNATAQSKMIGDMLDMNRIARGKVTLDLSLLKLPEFVESCCASHRPTAEAKGVSIVWQPGLLLDATILADRDRLQQVLGNLLSNAIKFTPSNGSVTVSVRNADGWYEILVADTGEGIPADMLPFVFDRFRQGAQQISRRHGGLGLGLAIARQLTALHGGEVAVTSEGAGKGATFTVRLPADSEVFADIVSDVATRSLRPRQSTPIAADSLRDIQIYVVDDEPAILEYTLNLLAEHGARVKGFHSGEQVLDALRLMRSGKKNCTVLVTDLGLKGMSGFALVEAIRTQLNLGQETLPALAATAFAREQDRDYAFSVGFQDYLTKPYEAAQLITAIRQLAKNETDNRPSSH